jgi:hypothetical protein
LNLVILGTAHSMADAPYDDPAWEIWACAPAITYAAYKRADRLFELHTESYWREGAIAERINATGLPVMMQRAFPDAPKSERFPLDEMMAGFAALGYAGARYYGSTIGYMLAYALHLGKYDRIALWGVNMAADEEYGKQLPAVCYWVGVANGRNIKVDIPPASAVCNAPRLYAYDADSALLTEARKYQAMLERGFQESKARLDRNVQEMYELSGGVKALTKLHKDLS